MATLAQRFMTNPVFSAVYEGLWRPAFTRLFSLGGPGTAEFDKALTAYLARSGDRTILDVACGPGLYTRRLAANLTSDGRCVGIDFSGAMLAQAEKFADVVKIRRELKATASLARTITWTGTDEQKRTLKKARTSILAAIIEAKRTLHESLAADAHDHDATDHSPTPLTDAELQELRTILAKLTK